MKDATTGQRGGSPLSAGRRVAGWGLGVGGTVLLTLLFTAPNTDVTEGSRLLVYFLLVLAAAATGGLGPALCTAVLATLAINWYFTPPVHRWVIDDFQNVLDLAFFAVAGIGVSLLATQMAQRSAEAVRARTEAGVLAQAAGAIAGRDDPLPWIIQTLQTALELDGVAVLRYSAGAWNVVTTAGRGSPRTPEEASVIVNLDGDAVLAMRGHVGVDQTQVVGAFAAQLAAALERTQLRAEADRAAVIAEADALRTALLRAVSHDLRTPLAGIKASVTSLLDRGVHWTPEVEKEFLEAIDEETDRLNTLVGNLLDMSRLEAGAVRPAVREVGLDEIVASALASISGSWSNFDVDIPVDLPGVMVDPVLLERAVANLISNAIAASPQGEAVRIEARVEGHRAELGIIDRGRGVAAADHDRIFVPFQRLDDRGGGVGLGLAVAKGLVEVMGGEIRPQTTPGGGLRMVVRVPAATGDDRLLRPS